MLWPGCVELPRCSGCCNTAARRCTPSRIHTRQLKVAKIEYTRKRLRMKEVLVKMEEHLECRCECVPETACGDLEVYDRDACKCVPARRKKRRRQLCQDHMGPKGECVAPRQVPSQPWHAALRSDRTAEHHADSTAAHCCGQNRRRQNHRTPHGQNRSTVLRTEPQKAEPQNIAWTEPQKAEPQNATWTETQNTKRTKPQKAEAQNATWTEAQNATWTEAQNATRTEPQNATWTEPQNATWTEAQNATWTEAQNATRTEPQNATWTEPQRTEPQNATRTEPQHTAADGANALEDSPSGMAHALLAKRAV
ncbi:uncharacterized protein LOC116949539 isoform X2 [Petromyzon marinus]